MSQPSKFKLFFRKIAGLFYRFDDAEPRPQITRSPSGKNLPVNMPDKLPDDKTNDNEKIRRPVIEETHKISPAKKDTAAKPDKKEGFPFPDKQNNPRANAEDDQPLFSDEPAPADYNMEDTQNDSKTVASKTLEDNDIECAISAGARAQKLANEAAAHGVKNKYAPIVSFRNVNKIFNLGTPKEFFALQNINFEIEDLPDVGEFIALVGPSGCGKSTVLNLIQGFQEVGGPTTGEVLVRNRPVTGPGRDRGMIFQKYSSFPHLTVLQNVMFGLELNRESLGYSTMVMEKLSREMLAKVGMEGHEEKYPYQLSGGQQQRVAIARTLVLKPRIILMDEPFSALDEPTRIEMQQLITNLWEEVEATVFIVTHSIAEAVYLSDRIFMFKANPGRLVSQIPVMADDIGKHPGMSPLEVQESKKFNDFLKQITDEFIRIGGTA